MKLTKAQLKEMRLKPCLACGKSPTDISHIKSRGSGAKLNEHEVISLCRSCHAAQHSFGWGRFLEMYPEVEKEITRKGWEIDRTHGRFRFIRSN